MSEVTIDGFTGGLIEVREFKDSCACAAYIDYDGYGYAVKNGALMKREGHSLDVWHKNYVVVIPSKRHLVPPDATHVLWFNR